MIERKQRNEIAPNENQTEARHNRLSWLASVAAGFILTVLPYLTAAMGRPFPDWVSLIGFTLGLFAFGHGAVSLIASGVSRGKVVLIVAIVALLLIALRVVAGHYGVLL